jgi:YidC/Oxa1 family membrane protein insertase
MLMVWIFPFGVLIAGSFLPVAILVYWLANNTWTLVQQHYIDHRLDQQERRIGGWTPDRLRRLRRRRE